MAQALTGNAVRYATGGGCGVLGLVYNGSCECSGLCQTVMVCFGAVQCLFPISMEISRHLRYRLIHIWAAFPAELCCRGVGILIATVSLAACQPASFFSSKDLLKGIYNSLKAGCHSAGCHHGSNVCSRVICDSCCRHLPIRNRVCASKVWPARCFY